MWIWSSLKQEVNHSGRRTFIFVISSVLIFVSPKLNSFYMLAVWWNCRQTSRENRWRLRKIELISFVKNTYCSILDWILIHGSSFYSTLATWNHPYAVYIPVQPSPWHPLTKFSIELKRGTTIQSLLWLTCLVPQFTLWSCVTSSNAMPHHY